jgi:hypothetical protein
MRVWAPLRVAVLVVALLVLSGHAAFGAPQVLYDSGLTWPLAPYLAIFDEDLDDENGVGEEWVVESPAPPSAAASGVTLEALLPIRTPEMSPGVVRARGPQAAATGARPARNISAAAPAICQGLWSPPRRDIPAARSCLRRP